MVGDLFTRLQEARLKIEEAKKRLNTIIVETQSEDGAIKVKANANKILTSIEISEDISKTARAELEERLMSTINRALEEAAQKGEMEMKEITKDMLPNFPGLI